jgi:hypothetical protein
VDDRVEVVDAAAEVRAAAAAYAEALHRCDTEALAGLFAATARLYAAGDPDGLPRDAWLARVAARERPGAGVPAEYAVEMVDVSGPDTGIARVSVRAGPRRFTDYLSLVRLDGGWRVIAKLYRQTEGPPL